MPITADAADGPVSILLVEDDLPTLARLAGALETEPQFRVQSVSTLATGREALRLHPPDVLLTDLQLPDGHGVDLIRELRAVSPNAEIMVISVLGDEVSVVAAISAGATGYILKDAFVQDITASVRDLVAGHSPISASIARYIVRRAQSGRQDQRAGSLNTSGLTPRELDILWGIAKGFSYADIATQLDISRQTVPGHIKSIYRKLEVNSRSQAVFEAVQQGLIQL